MKKYLINNQLVKLLLLISLFCFSLIQVQAADIRLSEEKDITTIQLALLADEDFTRLALLDYHKDDSIRIMISKMLNNLRLEDLLVDENDNTYHLSITNFNQAFNELYGLETSKLRVDDYPSTIKINEATDEIIFNLDTAAYNDNLVLLGIKSLNKSGKNLIANLYIYEVYTNDSELETSIINELKNLLITEDFLNQSFLDTYGVKVSHQEITFKEIPDGKYFKYQVIGTRTPAANEGNYLSQNTLLIIYAIIGGIVIGFIPFIYFKIKQANR